MRIIFFLFASVLLLSACTKDKIPTPIDTRRFDVVVTGNITTVRNLPADTIIGFNAIGQPVGHHADVIGCKYGFYGGSKCLVSGT